MANTTLNKARIIGVVGLGVALSVPALVVAQIGTEFGATEAFADGETLTADKLNRLVTSLRVAQTEAAAAPGLGSVVAHMPNVTGAETIVQMNARGWAVCDGSSTAEVAGAVISATPDLRGQFLRGVGAAGPATAGAAQADATAVNGLSFVHTHLDRASDSPTFCNPGSVAARLDGVQVEWTVAGNTANRGCNYLTGPPTTTGSDAANVTSSDSETRPANVGVVWMMRVR